MSSVCALAVNTHLLRPDGARALALAALVSRTSLGNEARALTPDALSPSRAVTALTPRLQGGGSVGDLGRGDRDRLVHGLADPDSDALGRVLWGCSWVV